MKESLFNFGTENNLVGMLVSPDSQKKNSSIPGVIFLNAGLLHRVGPYRQWVSLSRTLASSGITSFRFDLSGLGDSESSSHAANDLDRAKSDLAQALEFFEKKTGINKFILVGLCSGADYAHPFALEDHRISGLLLIDGYGYVTKKFKNVALLKKLISPKSWKNKIMGLFGKSKPLDARANRLKPETYVREFPPREQIANEIQQLSNRRVQMLYLYTSGVSDYYNYHGQFWDMLTPLTPDSTHHNVDTEYYPLSSHTFTFLEDRAQMFERVSTWILKRNWKS